MNSPNLDVTIRVVEPAGLARVDEPVRIGVPLPCGAVRDLDTLRLEDERGQSLPLQVRSSASWSDGSLRWVLADTVLSIGAGEQRVLQLRRGNAAPSPAALQVIEADDWIQVDTGVAVFRVPRDGAAIVSSVQLEGREQLASDGVRIRLLDGRNCERQACIKVARVQDQGNLRVEIVLEGVFAGTDPHHPLEFLARLTFIAGSAVLDTEFRIRNPRRALHAGGLWDLGDPGSQMIRELELDLQPSTTPQAVRWSPEYGGPMRDGDPVSGWVLYQDSSGGEHWDSPNHLDADGQLAVVFRGYQVRNAAGSILETGHRASPSVVLACGDAAVGCAVADFWQNFPKALRVVDGRMQLALFPSETRMPLELQGGEQKRHRCWVAFGRPSQVAGLLDRVQRPPRVILDPQYLEATHAMHGFVAPRATDDPRYLAYVRTIIEGEHSFFAGREVIDEYGWRNFGDVYADHEAVNHKGPEPFISHYNNQYDVLSGALHQGLRSGDARWFELARDLARHVVDIDIYHTRHDKAAYNGGLFWHSDHHLPAALATHRTYSRLNAKEGYGGGPDNEHNYTSGLLAYYFLTGDLEAREAVCTLAEFVISMDDGRRTIFRLIDRGPTGNASKTVSADYHGPGRGAGNSINALLDAYVLTRERRYLEKAEQLVERCIHPDDDLAQRRLDEPEIRWSYLVFLQTLDKYLTVKSEGNEFDHLFLYARDSLLRYAEWMLQHERPYTEVLHKVLLPTETWPAQDIRKARVLAAAAAYSPQEALAQRLRSGAIEYADRCMTDLLKFPTSHLVRPRVLLAVYGMLPEHGGSAGKGTPAWTADRRGNSRPARFIRQRQRVIRRLKGAALLAAGLLVAFAGLVQIGSRYYSLPPTFLLTQVIRVVASPILAQAYASDLKEAEQITSGYWHGAHAGLKDLPAVPFVYELSDAPHLASMRQQFELENVVSGAQSEYEAVLKLGAWVGGQFDHGSDQVVGGDKACDPVGLIKAGRLGSKYWCEIAARVMVHAAASLALPARIVTASRNGYVWEHAVTEIWSNEYGKWFVVDTDFNQVYERSGVPLSAIELVSHGREWRADGTLIVRSIAPSKPSIPDADPLELYQYVHVDMRTDWCSRSLRRGSPASGDRATWWMARPDFRPLLTTRRRIEDPATLNWAVNSIYLVSSEVSPSGGRTVEWAAYSPYFDHIERQTASGDWLPEDGQAIIVQSAEKSLRLRVVTREGWKGPVFSFDLLPPARESR